MASIHPLLAPYIPSDSDPFDDVKAAHLLNRAGFGGTLEEIQNVKKLGPSNAVDWLLDFPDAPADEEDGDDSPNLSSIEGSPPDFREYARRLAGKTREEKKQLIQQFMQANRQAIQATVGWWLKRMAWEISAAGEADVFLARAFHHQRQGRAGGDSDVAAKRVAASKCRRQF